MENYFRFSSKKKPGSGDFPDDLCQMYDDFLMLPVTSSDIQRIDSSSQWSFNHDTHFVIQIRENC